MRRLEKGMYATSLAGHDKGRLYIIIEENEKYVILSDGRSHPLERPKKKKRIHIQPEYKTADCLADKIMGQQALNNQDIADAIHARRK
uniref:KOW domain-containing RNA-binding protein n=1 Tax=Eubacterium cellulosolvens TaxID=29322 RepID=UPI0004878B53|nr:KOW domain-containing RNA-binding protein [[Eubacterium] cellulosolvens]